MEQQQKHYWKGIEQLSNDPEFVKHADKEFPDYLPINTEKREGGSGMTSSRRDFLKLMGFGISAATLAACETPIKKAIPYVTKPVDVDPGIPNYYATTYINGGDAVPIVVKTREGRPIKIEGNKLAPLSQGSIDSRVEASVLTVYDHERLKGPQMDGKDVSWEELDAEVKKALGAARSIRIISNTVVSPTVKKAVAEFTTAYTNASHVAYDPQSAYGILEGNRLSFGKAVVPAYHFDKAKVILSLGADFLGTWIAPTDFTKQYSKTRNLRNGKAEMSRHYQFEANLSLTGANADYRTPVKPSAEAGLAAVLFNEIARIIGTNTRVPAPDLGEVKNLTRAADELFKANGNALVVAGSNDPQVQVLVNSINQMLGSYGKTIDLDTPLHYRQGDDKAMNQFIDQVKGGQVDAVVFYNANPVYDHPRGEELAEALENVPVVIATNDRADETASFAKYLAPDNHFLESWGDAELKAGHLSLVQPTISPIFNTRQVPVSFLTWAGKDNVDYLAYLQDHWKSTYFSGAGDFVSWWDQCLHNGFYVAQLPATEPTPLNTAGNLQEAGRLVKQRYTPSTGIELSLYGKVAIGIDGGALANNPWLHEAPDAITKATWDNYLTISLKMANDMGLTMKEGKTQLVKLTVNGSSIEVPVLIQPGQAKGTVGLALGYGRTKAGKVANGVGVNAWPMASAANGFVELMAADVKVEKTGKAYAIAQTQTHNTYMGRETVVQEATLDEYKKDPAAGRWEPHVTTYSGEADPTSITLWKGHEYKNHHWGLIVDMSTCTGCSACHVACQVENNIPVVGKQEVLNRREMHWLRIDRYYSSDATPNDMKGLEDASENPEVTFQPMMCQHCNNAPCETVCPVVATTHSSEGLNQMTYNRCIGTRYCANNCPYKVRRFNWFKYHDNRQFDKNVAMNEELGKMVLNPDVTVRARGVMEKCSFCVQRIQAGKLEAKKEGRRPIDGEITSACAAACPTDALVFGDMNDPESQISKQLKLKSIDGGKTKAVTEPRAYHVLKELRVVPNVHYFTKIRNKDKADSQRTAIKDAPSPVAEKTQAEA